MLTVGAVSYINALPFFCDLAPFKDTRFIFDHPVKINALLQEGAIDVGLISSSSYLQHKELYELLPGYGIGATGRVMSVCLFTKFSLQELSFKKIALPATSATSNQLLKVLCRQFWKTSPEFTTFDGSYTQRLEDENDGFVLIGDSCLQYTPHPGFEKIDLASEWHTHTQLPFIFALFAARKERAQEKQVSIQTFMNRLQACKNDPNHLILAARQRVPLEEPLLRCYFQTIDYQLTKDHYRGLNLFDTFR